MKKVLILGFTPGECALKRALFEKLFPKALLVCADEWYLEQARAQEADALLINCAASEWKAMQALRTYGREKPVVLWAERMPSVPFVLLLQKEVSASLFFAPLDMQELSACAEAVAQGKLFATRAVLRLDAEKNVLDFLDFTKLSKNARLALFGLYSGLAVKEIAELMERSVTFASVTLNRLKEKSGIFDKRELLVNTLDWIKLGAVSQ